MGPGVPDGYLPRIVDSELDVLCAELPAVALEGPRAVGKTETTLRRATTVHRLDDIAEFDIARADPSRLAKGHPLVLIDEWQRLPESWDVVRRAVDADPRTPRFLLTGSAAPAQAPTHSGAGRIVTVCMRPLSLAARLLETDADALLEGRDSGWRIPRDASLLGALFQSLVTLSVRVYAQANEAKVFHLRTQGGEHEVDLIVQGAGGRVVALEVKLTQTASHSDTRHLRWLAERIGPTLADAAVITTGPEAYRRPDGIAVIPAALLTA